MLAVLRRPVGYTPRSDAGLAGFERILARAGLAPVAGIDEAGRGACAGPLVVAAAVLRTPRSGGSIPGIPGLADSKTLTAPVREEIYQQIMKAAVDWSVVIIPSADVDRLGLHVCNVSGMRRALAGLRDRPGYVLTDGFPVRGLTVPALAMWKGDQVAACVAAASIIAKVTRDRLMSDLHGDYPGYGFNRHKGYSTPSHMKALAQHGPCPEHRRSFVNVGGRREDLAEAPELDDELAREPADLAGQGGASDNGHNGSIVDVIEEHVLEGGRR
jgi:ribonuclease HII